jgi:hypothetical protein
MTLNGTLEDFSPAGILKVLAADGRTGAARFGGPAGCTVYLHRGQLYFARNENTDEALATALVRPGRLTADDWGRAIDASGERPMVGELLVRDSAIAPDLLASVVLSVVYDPLIDLFRDGTGEFDFETDTVHWLGPFRAFPVEAIIDEVRTRVREADEWASHIPTLDVWVEARRTLPGSAAQVTLLREDWELVTALTGPRSIPELATELGRGAYSTARVVHRLQQAGLVEIVSNDLDAQVVPIRRVDPVLEEEPPAPDLERDPLLDMGLPHRTASSADALTATIGDAIADALATGRSEGATGSFADPTTGDGPDGLTEVDHSIPQPTESWDESKRVSGEQALHHDDVEPTSLDEPRPSDPNAAWLADLYAQFIDDTESAGTTKKKRRGDTQALDVAFKAEAVDGEAKVSTLKRLLGALKKV